MDILATLGMAIDSRASDQAAKSLDQMADSAKKAEDNVKKMGKETSNSMKESAEATKQFEKAMVSASIQGEVIGQAIAKGIHLAIEAVKKLDEMINKVGDYQDIAEMTGASAAGLSRLRVAADVAGVSMDKVGNIITMMTRQISASADESKGAGKALAELGINIDKFRQLKGDEQIQLLAGALSKVEDSGGKSALILDVVGRGGAEAAKLFKALGEDINQTTGYTEEQIAAMDDYSDANKRARAQMSLLMEHLAVEMAPAFAAFKLALRDTISELMGVAKSSSDLEKEKGALAFAYAVGVGLANVIDLATKAASNIIAFGKTIGALAAAGATLISGGGMKGVSEVFAALNEDIAQMRERMNFNTAASFEKHFQEIVSGEKKVTSDIDKELSGRVANHKRANDRMTEEERAAQRAALAALREAERERKKELDFRIKWGRQRAIEEGQAVNKAAEEAEKQREKARQAQIEADDKNLEASQNEINAITKRAAGLEEEVRTRGMLKSAIEEEHLAILEKDRDQFEGNDQALEQLDKKIEAQKRLVEALKGEETMKANEEAAKKAADEWERSWQQVGQSLTDELMRGGKNAAQLLKNLFQTLVLKPTIMAGVAGLVGGSAAGAAAAGGNPLGSVAGSLMGTVGSFFGAGGISGAISAGAGWLTGATTFGGAMSAATSLIGTGSLGGVASGLGMMVGALGPIAVGVYGIASLLGAGKHGGPKTGGAYNLLGAPGIVGPDDNAMTSALMKSARQTLDNFNKLVTQLGGSNPGISFGLGVSADPRGTSPTFVQSQVVQNGQLLSNIVNKNVGRDEAAMQAEIQRQLTDSIITALHHSNIDQEILAYFDQVTAGLDDAGKASALELLPQLAQLKQAFAAMSTVFPYLSTTSIAARMNMAQLAGGIDQLAGLMNGFMSTFFTAGEQLSIVSGQLQQQLAMVGIQADVMNMSMQQYRDMVMSLSQQTNTAAGQAAFVSSLQAAPVFAQFKQQQEAEAERQRMEWEQEQARQQAEWERQQAEAERAAQQAQAEYDRRLAEAQNNLENAYRKQRDEIDKTISSLENWKDTLESLQTALAGDASLSPLTPAQQYAASKERFRQLASAAATDPKAQAQFEGSARQFLQLSRQQYASGARYTQDFELVASTIQMLESSAETQLTDAQRAQQALDTQVSQLINIDRGVMSVEQAIRELIAVTQNKPVPYTAPTYTPAAYTPSAPAAYTPPAYTYTPPPPPPPPPPATSGLGGGGSGLSAAAGTFNIATSQGMLDWVRTLGADPTGFASGLERVPRDRYPAILHKDERVQTAHEANFFRGNNLLRELVAMRAEISHLRRESRQDAGNAIGALFESMQRAAEKQSDATMRAARQRAYQSRPRSVLT